MIPFTFKEEDHKMIKTDQKKFDQMVAELGLLSPPYETTSWRLVCHYILLPLWDKDTIHARWPKKKLAKALYQCLQEEDFAVWLRAIAHPLFIQALHRWQNASPSDRSRHWLKLSVDDSHTWHSRNTKKMKGLRKLYDYVQKRYAKGFNFVVILMQVGHGEMIPLDIALSVSKKVPGYQSKPVLVKMMLATLERLVIENGFSLEILKNIAVVADSAYFCTALVESHWRFVRKASPGQIFYADDFALLIRELVNPLDLDGKYFRNSCQIPSTHQYLRLLVEHPEWGELLLIILRISLDEGEKRMVFVSNDLTLTGPQVLRLYSERIVIEQFFKECKQYGGMQKVRFQRGESIVAHFALRALTMLLINRFRQKYCRPSRTSCEKVVLRLRKAELKVPSIKSLQRKFISRTQLSSAA
jgi:hypothetical protein